MEHLQHLFGYVIHIDDYLFQFVRTYGAWTYAILFLIIFTETGLVIFPFLPGDSLLFAAGSIAAHPDAQLSIQMLLLILILASFTGNKVNYLIGLFIGPRVFKAKSSWFFKKGHLLRAHQFYERHGGKTIIISRFLPFLRTFVPFVAGVAYMSLPKFAAYNMASAILWVGSLLGFGYFFGTLPFVREHFSLVIYGIIILTLIPPGVIFVYHQFAAKR